jgi:hypothetical protein
VDWVAIERRRNGVREEEVGEGRVRWRSGGEANLAVERSNRI